MRAWKFLLVFLLLASSVAAETRVCIHRDEDGGVMNLHPVQVLLTGKDGNSQQAVLTGGQTACVPVAPGTVQAEARSRRPYDPNATDENECRSNRVSLDARAGQETWLEVSPRSRGSAYACGWTLYRQESSAAGGGGDNTAILAAVIAGSQATRLT